LSQKIPNLKKIEKATKLLLEAIGEDVTREGLKETPHRVAKMWQEYFDMREYNFKEFAEVDTLNNGFVMVRNIPVNSLCEHHLVPFIGTANVAYFPKVLDDGTKSIIGISKIARVVYKYAYRPQVQERLTLQILNEIKELIKTDDIIVHVDAQHLCMSMRGARAGQSTTTTMDYDGVFTNVDLRREFLMLIDRKGR
jgi:GTP cyclohydrolase I